jgi:hypothetical protein
MSIRRSNDFESRARDCERRAYGSDDYEYREWMYIKERQYADMARGARETPTPPETSKEAESDKP